MKILILSPKPPYPAKDGSSLATARVIEGLAARGHHVTVFFLNTSKHHADPEELSARENISFFSAFCDTAVRPLPALVSLLAGKRPYTVSRFINAKSVSALQKILQQTPWDIIQI